MPFKRRRWTWRTFSSLLLAVLRLACALDRHWSMWRGRTQATSRTGVRIERTWDHACVKDARMRRAAIGQGQTSNSRPLHWDLLFGVVSLGLQPGQSDASEQSLPLGRREPR